MSAKLFAFRNIVKTVATFLAVLICRPCTIYTVTAVLTNFFTRATCTCKTALAKLLVFTSHKAFVTVKTMGFVLEVAIRAGTAVVANIVACGNAVITVKTMVEVGNVTIRTAQTIRAPVGININKACATLSAMALLIAIRIGTAV